MRREKKSLVPTDKGLAVYQIVKDKRIADVEMTGQWETALAKIESGEMNPDTFRKASRSMPPRLPKNSCKCRYRWRTADISRVPSAVPVASSFTRSRQVQQRRLWAYRLPQQGEKQLTDSQIADLVTKGKTSLIKGFRSREGKPFDAYLTFDKDFHTVYGFPPRTDKPKGKERRR